MAASSNRRGGRGPTRTTGVDLDDVNWALGSLTTEVLALKEAINKISAMNDDAQSYRQAMRVEFAALSEKTKSLESSVQAVKEVTDDIQMWKQRGIGALAMVGLAAGALGSLITATIIHYLDFILKALGGK